MGDAMSFVLIVIFSVATVTGPDSRVHMRESKAVAMQEFSSQTTCEAAAKVIRPAVFTAICVPK